MAIMDDALGGSVENIAAHFLLRRMDALSSLLKGAVIYHILLGIVIFHFKVCHCLPLYTHITWQRDNFVLYFFIAFF